MLRKMLFKPTPEYGYSVPPSFDGRNFSSVQSLVIPSHDEYNLDDLLNSGVKVSPVNTAILHDAGAAERNIDAFIASEAHNNDVVEPKNE